MARKRSLTSRLSRALLAIAAVSAIATPALADVAIVPSADGHVGAWLVSGPIGKGGAIDASTIAPKAGEAGQRFRVISARDGAIDLDKTLGTDRKSGATALVGGELSLSEDLSGWLLLSIDGAVDVFVDGKSIFKRDIARLRDGAWDALPIDLAKGGHRIVLEMQAPGEWWAAEIRILDRRDLLPPRQAALVLPGVTDSEAGRLARDLATVSLDSGLDADGYHPRFRLEYRRGAPQGLEPAIALELRAPGTPASFRAGSLVLGERGVLPFEARLPAIATTEIGTATNLEVGAKLGKIELRATAAISSELPALVARARDRAAEVEKGSIKVSDPETVATTLRYEVDELRKKPSTDIRQKLGAWLSLLESGHDPMHEHGVIALARRSPVDGEPDPALVHVPARYTPGTNEKWPLVVALHGLNGTPERILEAFLDTKNKTPSVDGFIIAPHAHGNVFYRGPGEREVMSAIDWMIEKYPIDRERVSITGVSMGGTGTAHIALRYPDRFSAAAPLCGYHSYFVRRDTQKRPIRPWEREQMHHFSPASWAERGRSLPMWVAHGTKDFPLENSRVLVNRYKELGYSMTDEWPDTGHDVWTKAYAGARLFPWLARAKHDPSPKRVTVKSDQLRYARQAWVAITRFETPGHMGSVDADATGPNRIEVKTDSVNAFELTRPAGKIADNAALEVVADGQTLSFAAGEALALRREGSWVKGKPDMTGEKHAGVEGPIRDAYLEPLVFVYGSLDPRTARANREVAEAFARTRHGPEVGYRVIADRDLDEATEKANALFLVGTPRDHRLLAKIGASLPIHVDSSSLIVGSEHFDAPGTGAIFVHPNPRHPDRVLVIATGIDAAGVWRALSVPQLMPDFLVYDAAIAPAAGEILLGRDAHVLAGGFFDRNWKLPAMIRDPEASH